MKEINTNTYQSDNGLITFIQGDCMDVLTGCIDRGFTLACVDVPYGINEEGQRNVTGDRPTKKWKNPKSKIYKTFDDSKPPSPSYWEELFRRTKNQIVWGGNYFSEYLPSSKGWIVWDKQVDIKEHLSMCELAWTSFNVKCNKFTYLWAGFKKAKQEERFHVCQKPVDLYRWIFQNYAKPTDHILDTHGGSMSSAIAAHMEGLRMTIVELDPDYFKAALKRFSIYEAQQTIKF